MFELGFLKGREPCLQLCNLELSRQHLPDRINLDAGVQIPEYCDHEIFCLQGFVANNLWNADDPGLWLSVWLTVAVRALHRQPGFFFRQPRDLVSAIAVVLELWIGEVAFSRAVKCIACTVITPPQMCRHRASCAAGLSSTTRCLRAGMPWSSIFGMEVSGSRDLAGHFAFRRARISRLIYLRSVSACFRRVVRRNFFLSRICCSFFQEFPYLSDVIFRLGGRHIDSFAR